MLYHKACFMSVANQTTGSLTLVNENCPTKIYYVDNKLNVLANYTKLVLIHVPAQQNKMAVISISFVNVSSILSIFPFKLYTHD